jgi:glycosyltransferase involved in cell wall biosynthesis
MPELSVIVPAHHAHHELERSIAALRASDLPSEMWELIVVDDGSEDPDTTRVAAAADRVVTLPSPAGGPARARNAGVEIARAPIVAFVDADVLVHRDALRLLLETFGDATVSAAFGSYDDTPAAPGIVSQYRNLLHHHVHQMSAGDVESFWAGLGAVRKDAFQSVGMFDSAKYRKPEMEDVELGYRLRDSGYRIVSVPSVLGTHLKRWTLWRMITSDFTRRGVPWARLLHERGWLLSPRGLSLGASERAGAFLACATVLAAVAALACQSSAIGMIGLALFAAFAAVNHRLFGWLARIRGVPFSFASVPLHIVYNVVAVSALLWGATLAALSPSGPARYTRPR